MSSLFAFDWDPETYREWVDREVIATVRTLMWVKRSRVFNRKATLGQIGERWIIALRLPATTCSNNTCIAS